MNNSVVEPCKAMRAIAAIEVLSLAVAILYCKFAPLISVSALLMFFTLNGIFFFMKASTYHESRRRFVNVMTAGSSLAIPYVLIAFLIIHGLN